MASVIVRQFTFGERYQFVERRWFRPSRHLLRGLFEQRRQSGVTASWWKHRVASLPEGPERGVRFGDRQRHFHDERQPLRAKFRRRRRQRREGIGRAELIPQRDL